MDYILSNATDTNYLTIFLQIVDIANSYWFSYRPTPNITFLLTKNHPSHSQFVKKKKKNHKIVCDYFPYILPCHQHRHIKKKKLTTTILVAI